MLGDGDTHRKQFSQSSGVQKQKARPTFSVPFDNGLCKHFFDGTGLSLRHNAEYKQFYCFLDTPQKISMAEDWERSQGSRVFIRNLLRSSLALDVNFFDNVSGAKTDIGNLEERAKHHQDADAIKRLAEISSITISGVSYLHETHAICAVPALKDKIFDLPREITRIASRITGKFDVTGFFDLDGKDFSSKENALSEKWDNWERCIFKYSGPSLAGLSVIILDDKYQSGITQQFFASKLLELGCSSVHGLSMVKTLRDTDNNTVVDV